MPVLSHIVQDWKCKVVQQSILYCYFLVILLWTKPKLNRICIQSPDPLSVTVLKNSCFLPDRKAEKYLLLILLPIFITSELLSKIAGQNIPQRSKRCSFQQQIKAAGQVFFSFFPSHTKTVASNFTRLTLYMKHPILLKTQLTKRQLLFLKMCLSSSGSSKRQLSHWIKDYSKLIYLYMEPDLLGQKSPESWFSCEVSQNFSLLI